jgi:membrane fusion protein, heavy metal efflux system
MAISNKQRIAMAVIVFVGLLGGGAVLMSERAKTGGEEAEHSEAGHSEKDEHAADAKTAHKEGEKDEHGHEAKAEPKGGHKEGEKEEHEERQVKLTEEQLKGSGITVQAAGPAKLQAAAQFQGEIRFNEDRTTHVVPRLAGVAESVNANLGQLVQKGQVMAVVTSTSLSEQRSELLTAQKRRDLAKSTYEREKKLWEDKISAQQDYQQSQSALQEAEIAVQNASQKLAAVGATGSSTGLNRFEIRAPFSGTVVEKHLSLGEAVKEDASIFTVSDLSSVWAEFAVSPKDLAAVRVGQRVIVSSTAFDSKVEGTIAYVGALLGEQTAPVSS